MKTALRDARGQRSASSAKGGVGSSSDPGDGKRARLDLGRVLRMRAPPFRVRWRNKFKNSRAPALLVSSLRRASPPRRRRRRRSAVVPAGRARPPSSPPFIASRPSVSHVLRFPCFLVGFVFLVRFVCPVFPRPFYLLVWPIIDYLYLKCFSRVLHTYLKTL